MNDPNPTQRRRPRWMAAAALSAAFLAGGITVSGVAAVAQGMGEHMMGGHDASHMMAHFNAALDAVGATADQKTRIEALLHTGMAPMMDVHGGMAAAHNQLIGLLTAPTIDRGALEQVRAGEIAKLDEASRSMTGSLADAASVLTPEQRAKLAQLVKDHHPPA
jgi:Spy/CpxP family protein refolding chaperone